MSALSDDELVKEINRLKSWLAGPRQAYADDLIARIKGEAPEPEAAAEAVPAKKTAAKTATKKTAAKKAAPARMSTRAKV
jgi:hypothetical protein